MPGFLEKNCDNLTNQVAQYNHKSQGGWEDLVPCLEDDSNKKATWKGNNPRNRGLAITMVISHLQVMGWSSKWRVPFFEIWHIIPS